MTQAEIIREALDAQGITAYELAKQMEINESFVYNTLHGRTNMTNHDTLLKMASIIPVDVDRMYIAADRIPPDVTAALINYPELLQVVRNLEQRLTLTEDSPR